MDAKRLTNILKLPIYYYPQLDSTGNLLREMAMLGAPEGTIVIAGKQTNGRGQRNHGWYSPPGGLYFSMLFKPGEIDLSGFSLVVGGSVVQAIEGSWAKGVAIKWPNDLFLRKKKIGGILCQKFTENLLLGIGLNTFAEPCQWPSDIRGKAAVLGEDKQGESAREELFISIVRHLLADYEIFYHKGFLHFKESLQALSLLQGKKVVLNTGEQGVVVGYSDVGGLLLLDKDGSLKIYYSERVLSFA